MCTGDSALHVSRAIDSGKPGETEDIACMQVHLRAFGHMGMCVEPCS